MPDWLSAALAVPAVSSLLIALALIVPKALERRELAKSETLLARAALLDAEAQKLVAEARVRESQMRITEGDAEALRGALASATKEREEDRKEMRAKSVELEEARAEIRRVIQALEEERLRSASAEERASQMHRDFHAFFNEVRAGRTPRHTPPSFARVDHTQPFGVQR